MFYVQLDLVSDDTNFNNTHPRLQVASEHAIYLLLFDIKSYNQTLASDLGSTPWHRVAVTQTDHVEERDESGLGSTD